MCNHVRYLGEPSKPADDAKERTADAPFTNAKGTPPSLHKQPSLHTGTPARSQFPRLNSTRDHNSDDDNDDDDEDEDDEDHGDSEANAKSTSTSQATQAKPHAGPSSQRLALHHWSSQRIADRFSSVGVKINHFNPLEEQEHSAEYYEEIRLNDLLQEVS